MTPELHEPRIVTDGGPWAEHDMACAVCHVRKAVFDLNEGVFQPCSACQRDGWVLRRKLLSRLGAPAASGRGDSDGD